MKKIKYKYYITIIIGMFFLICSIFLLILIYVENKSAKENEIIKIEKFFTKQEIKKDLEIDNNKNISTSYSDYLFVLEIPKINLKKGIFNKKSKYNSVKYGIQILSNSNMPDENNGNVILASHRGTSPVSYFNRLFEMKSGDVVYLYYNNIKYVYEISSTYEVAKTGTVPIYRDSNKSVITLITCKKNEKKQLVFIGDLIDKEYY